jgi:hypothetical protein
MDKIKHWAEDLSVRLDAELVPDKELEQKIKNFTMALNELPCNIRLEMILKMDGKEINNKLHINLADILITQVKNHFGKN